MSRPDAHRILARVAREDWGRLLGRLIRRHGRPDLAEDALAEALASAAEQWPRRGVPDNPGGWLMTVAGRRTLDVIRAEANARGKAHLLAMAEQVPRHHAAGPGAEQDERLPLLFMATHPALAPDVRPALALRFVLGVPTADVAALFLVPTATMAARLTRAKRRLRTIGAGFEMPDLEVWPERVDDVARAIYLAFTAGYAPRAGERVVELTATAEAVRLSVLAAGLLPTEPALTALAALLTLQHARRDARTDAEGALIRLGDQDRTRWRREEIERGLAWLASLAPMTGYAEELRLQALIAAFHATAQTAAATDWPGIARTYARLEQLTGSPIVRLNRAVAVAEASGPMAGLRILRAVTDELPGHHRVHLVRAELLRREGDLEGARAAYDQALALCPDGPERRHLQAQRAGI